MGVATTSCCENPELWSTLVSPARGKPRQEMLCCAKQALSIASPSHYGQATVVAQVI